MNTTFLAFAFLFALRKTLLLGAVGSLPVQVVDTSGKKLRAAVDYYILPVSSTVCGGSGFVLAKVRNKTCPLDVVVVEGNCGEVLRFTPIGFKEDIVRVSTDLNIEFSNRVSCSESTVWKIDRFDRLTRKWFVTDGGVSGKPSWKTIENWFKIEKYENDYKIVYCPSFCEYCKVHCRDVGVYVDEKGNKRLALTDVPHKVRFQKA